MTNDEKQSYAEKALKTKKILYSIGIFLFILSFSLVYIAPDILHGKMFSEKILLISKNHSLGFLYDNDVFINAIVKIYFIFIYPLLMLCIIFVSLFVIYKISPRTPSIEIHKYREDIFLFLITILMCVVFILFMYFIEPHPPTLWQY